jgi:hypothetical protein
MRRRIHACHIRRRIYACHIRRRIYACHVRRRIHACHMRRRIHVIWRGGYMHVIARWELQYHKSAAVSLTLLRDVGRSLLTSVGLFWELSEEREREAPERHQKQRQ